MNVANDRYSLWGFSDAEAAERGRAIPWGSKKVATNADVDASTERLLAEMLFNSQLWSAVPPEAAADSLLGRAALSLGRPVC